MMIIFDILIGISILLLIGEIVVQTKLSKDSKFYKWWRKHIVGELSDDDPRF
jgi:hypothetical protein